MESYNEISAPTAIIYPNTLLDYSNYDLLCPNCKKTLPNLRMEEKEKELMVNISCQQCGHIGKKEINDFFNQCLEKNTNFCQKKDGSHSNKKATGKISGKYYCEECIKHYEDYFGMTSEKIENKNVCQIHFEKYKFYCENCQKDLCEKCSCDGHRESGHSLLDLQEEEKKIEIEILDKLLKYEEENLKAKIPEAKQKIKNELLKMINDLDNEYENFMKKKVI